MDRLVSLCLRANYISSAVIVIFNLCPLKWRGIQKLSKNYLFKSTFKGGVWREGLSIISFIAGKLKMKF